MAHTAPAKNWLVVFESAMPKEIPISCWPMVCAARGGETNLSSGWAWLVVAALVV
jgi:hypothetical protein